MQRICQQHNYNQAIILFGCAICVYRICDLLLFGDCTGRWYCTRVAFTSGLTGVAYKCNVLANAVCACCYRFVQVFNCNIPILGRNRFWVIAPHLFNCVNCTSYAWGCVTDMRNCGGNVVLGGMIVTCNHYPCSDTYTCPDNQKQ